MEESMPKVFKQLDKILTVLEKHYKDMQDVEFTVENNKLWMLQTRSGKRTSKSAVRIAVDMVKEKLISKKEAVMRIDPASLDTLLHPTLDEKSTVNVIANGLPASPGAASGKVVFSSEEAERLNNIMKDTILVRVETSPEDIHGMHAAKGILTARGGMTSHAAVVARGMGRPCVSGSSEIDINYEAKTFKTSSIEVKEGDIITIDGSTGRIILGEVPKSRAVLVSSGVSELVLTFNFLKPSAQLISFEKSPEISGLTVGTSPKIILPVEPSIVIISPSFTSIDCVLKTLAS